MIFPLYIVAYLLVVGDSRGRVRCESSKDLVSAKGVWDETVFIMKEHCLYAESQKFTLLQIKCPFESYCPLKTQ